MPHPRTLAAVAVTSLLLVAGCGGDDEKSSDSTASAPPASTSTQSSEAAAPPPADLPPYEDVKKIALADSGVKDLCSGKVEDRDIGQSPPGESYQRMFCRGAPVFEYVSGKGLYGENYKAAVDGSTDPLWHSDGQAYVKVESASMSDDFAEKVEKLCDCGEVVQGGFGN